MKPGLVSVYLFIAPILLSTLPEIQPAMDRMSFDYSTKNIPPATKPNYLKCLIEKTEHFIRRLRWRCFFYKYPNASSDNKETYGFKSRKSPPVIEELKEFENCMIDLVQSIKFKDSTNSFQEKLKSDIASIKEDKRITVKADKTTNFYKMETSKYNDLLHSNITKSYKKANEHEVTDINLGDKHIAQNLDLGDRIDQLAPKESFITLKDHKDNFNNRPTCRLINPTKSEIGLISKQILDKIINKVVKATRVNLWKSTRDVITWFNSLPNRSTSKFITFDIVEFYPSITEKLIMRALDFAEQYTEITQNDRDIIIHAKRSLLFSNGCPWKKKEPDQPFDVTMGSYDGAETCELVICYLLSLLHSKYGENVGLYRDDGLCAFDKTPREIENIKKDICSIFRENELRITIEANKVITDYLDVTLNLENGTHKPYMKPNNELKYVHVKSNHPPNVIKSIPEGINTRLSNLSSSEEIFDSSKSPYQNALNQSGHKYQLHYAPQPSTHRRKNRSRNITWYNPPFDVNVSTNIGKKFLNIIDKCFPQIHPLRKICNRNTLKLSYSCMPNIQSIVQSDCKNKLAQDAKVNENSENVNLCNCRKKDECPLKGQCLSRSVVYQATVKSDDATETYVGLTGNDFKSRYNNHTSTFRDSNKKLSTELSKHIWSLKDKGKNFTIDWKILGKAKTYSNITKKCNLCTLEKFFIICKPNIASLNKRSELINKCRHQNKYLLQSLKVNVT